MLFLIDQTKAQQLIAKNVRERNLEFNFTQQGLSELGYMSEL